MLLIEIDIQINEFADNLTSISQVEKHDMDIAHYFYKYW